MTRQQQKIKNVLYQRGVNPGMQLLYPIVFGFIFGFVIQRSRFCFAACFRDIFLIRNTAQTRAVLLALFINTLGFTLVHFLLDGDLAAAGHVYPVGLHTMVGGLLFGFGMVIAGSCVSGCLTRIGEGNLMQVVALLGILLGSYWVLGGLIGGCLQSLLLLPRFFCLPCLVGQRRWCCS